MIQLKFLDHVAIYVADLERSAKWYGEVLGLKRYTFKEWGPYPIFMLCGKSGLAIFPADPPTPLPPEIKNTIRIDHFAFNVDKENFEKAKQHYKDLGIAFNFQDHHFFHSIYTFDPDGHKVELTTIVVPEEGFYE